MHCPDPKLHTPIYLKTAPDLPWPEHEPVFYLLTRSGLFLCRNHPFFRSSVRADQWPDELAGHSAFLKISYPKLPRSLLERVVGFFAIIGERYASEAAVLLAWDQTTESVVPIVPDQCGIVGGSWFGDAFPIELHYEVPRLPPHLMLIGDIHSHVDGPAYTSGIDKADEEYRPGLHLVVGRLHREPPEFHCEVTVDGMRFRVKNLSDVLAGYHRRRRREVPQSWLDKVTVKMWKGSHGAPVLASPNALPTQGKGWALSPKAPPSLQPTAEPARPASAPSPIIGESNPATQPDCL